ncbi:hypothetical protein FUAX_52230 (plasmid) [Fulvitalea axinellae]|uniref:PH domain-containing protein n=1 Tax=Fulvitalea axinellae TaxID=1182444 RepID=A0AAU9DI50_9BACT|nr:hypothetical protein FUAX_52230 [Fulvitalea axinellae]
MEVINKNLKKHGLTVYQIQPNTNATLIILSIATLLIGLFYTADLGSVISFFIYSLIVGISLKTTILNFIIINRKKGELVFSTQNFFYKKVNLTNRSKIRIKTQTFKSKPIGGDIRLDHNRTGYEIYYKDSENEIPIKLYWDKEEALTEKKKIEKMLNVTKCMA